MSYLCCICKAPNGADEVCQPKCNHPTCWNCLNKHIMKNLAPKIKCPMNNCRNILSDRDVRKALSDKDEDKYDRILLNKVQYKVKCLLPECENVIICTESNIQFDCSECSLFNCLACMQPHATLTCLQYKSFEEADKICKAEIARATLKLKLKRRQRYLEMFREIDSNDLFIHDTLLDCPNCCRVLTKGDGVVLRCSHVFCRHCLREHIKSTLNIPVSCPSKGCQKPVEEREIIQLLNGEECQLYIDRCMSQTKSKFRSIFQCQSPNCTFFGTYRTIPKEVKCPLCGTVNCTKCYSIHPGQTCDQYMKQIAETPHGRTLKSIEDNIRKKVMMRCPKCQVLLQKLDGCSWVMCSSCSLEICWARQMSRWGPKGRGDISEGCKCGINGRCAKDCNNCHDFGYQKKF